MVGSVQIEIIKPPDSSIIKVHMDNSIIIRRPQEFGIGPEEKQLVKGLGIPCLKHIRQNPEAKMRSDKRNQD
jgi:hypothetical protein